MITHTELQNLFQKMLLGGVESVSAYQEYCRKRCHADQPQVKIDNSFLNYLSAQLTLDQCSSDVLHLVATIYCQNDGYAKPPKFIELLERLSTLPYLFKERVFRSFLLLGLVIKNKTNHSFEPQSLERLPSDLLFTIAGQLASLSTEDIRDIYKLIPTLSKELTFKVKYLARNNRVTLFFKSNPIAAKVKSGEPLLMGEVEKYAKEYPDSVEAKVYNQLNN